MFKTNHFAKIVGIVISLYLAGCTVAGQQGKKGTNPSFILTPVEQYSTEKARRLAQRYKPNLERLVVEIVQNPVTARLQFANNIAAPGGIGFFTHSATKSSDDRYLEVIVSVPDVLKAEDEASAKLERLFAHYGRELLATLAADKDLYAEKDIAGYGLNFSWRSRVQSPSGPRIIIERGVLYFEKEQAQRFLQKQLDRAQLLAAAVLFVMQDDRFVQFAYEAGQREAIAKALSSPVEPERPRFEPKPAETLRERDLPPEDPPLAPRVPEVAESPKASRDIKTEAGTPREEAVAKKRDAGESRTAKPQAKAQALEPAPPPLRAKPAEEIARSREVSPPPQSKKQSSSAPRVREPETKKETLPAPASKPQPDTVLKPERALPSAPPPGPVASEEKKTPQPVESPPAGDSGAAKPHPPSPRAGDSAAEGRALVEPPERTAKSVPPREGSAPLEKPARAEAAAGKAASVLPPSKAAVSEALPAPLPPRSPPAQEKEGERARAGLETVRKPGVSAAPTPPEAKREELARKRPEKVMPAPAEREPVAPRAAAEASKPSRTGEEKLPSEVASVRPARPSVEAKLASEGKVPKAPEPTQAPAETKRPEITEGRRDPVAEPVVRETSPPAGPPSQPRSEEKSAAAPEIARARPPAEEGPSSRPESKEPPPQIALGKRPEMIPPKPGVRELPKPPAEPVTPAPEAPKELSGFVIQLTFRQVGEAKRWMETLAKEGYPASMSAVREQELVRLRVGGFSTSAKAKELLERLKKQGLTGVVIHVPSG